MRHLLFLVLVCLFQLVIGQSIERQVISSGGSSTYEFTIGETIVHSDNLIVTVGFHQLQVDVQQDLLGLKDISYLLTVFPNPAVDMLTITGEGIGPDSEVEIYTLTGIRLALPIQKKNDAITIEFQETPSGNYVVRLSDHLSNTTANFKILKIN